MRVQYASVEMACKCWVPTLPLYQELSPTPQLDVQAFIKYMYSICYQAIPSVHGCCLSDAFDGFVLNGLLVYHKYNSSFTTWLLVTGNNTPSVTW